MATREDMRRENEAAGKRLQARTARLVLRIATREDRKRIQERMTKEAEFGGR